MKISKLLFYAFLTLCFNACSKNQTNPILQENNSVAVGKAYQGGIIAYVDQTGKHGIIAAPMDQGTVIWGCVGTVLTGADGIGINTGKQNTLDILNGCNMAGIAAKHCDNLVLNTYDDWYLPSKNELKELYANKLIIGNFNDGFYWSSSETSSNSAWGQSFLDGLQNEESKDLTLSVRAVRSF